MVLRWLKLFYSKVSSGFLRQVSQSGFFFLNFSGLVRLGPVWGKLSSGIGRYSQNWKVICLNPTILHSRALGPSLITKVLVPLGQTKYMAVNNISWVRLPPSSPKLVLGLPNNKWKNEKKPSACYNVLSQNRKSRQWPKYIKA